MTEPYDPKAVIEYAKRWLGNPEVAGYSDSREAADLFARALVDLAEPIVTVKCDMEPDELKRRLALINETRSVHRALILDAEVDAETRKETP